MATKLTLHGCGLAALLLILPSVGAVAQGNEGSQVGVEIGTLHCENLPDTRLNLLIYSSVEIHCVFKTASGQEAYNGETGIGLGVDLNWNRKEEILFTVLTAATDIRMGAHAMAGRYGGGKAALTLWRGLGAAGLIGGSGNNFALQPIAFEKSEGWGVAAGLAYLVLKADPTPQ